MKKIHPEAVKSFDAAADSLRQAARQVPRPAARRAGFEPDIQPKGAITADDIKAFGPMRRINALTGALVEIVYEEGDASYVLDSVACVALTALAEKICRVDVVKGNIGIERVEAALIEWADPTSNPVGTSFWEHFLKTVGSEVDTRTYWVPIANLHLQSDLPFGPVTFVTISREVIAAWRAALPPRDPDFPAAAHQEHFGRLQHRFQGHAAAKLKVNAEPTHGRMIAYETAVEAVALLRTFCPENRSCRLVSGVVPFGLEADPTCVIWREIETGAFETFTGALGGSLSSPWEISDTAAKKMYAAGLATLLMIFGDQNRTPMQQKVLDALRIYNRANVTRDPVDKLIFVFTALETMLLQGSEPIQHSVGDRLAFALELGTPDERAAIPALVRKGYSIRSGFVHHGRANLDDLETIDRVLQYAWLFFLRAIRATSVYETKEEFIKALDMRKFGA